MSRDRTWVSMGFHEGSLKKIISDISGIPSKDLTVEKGENTTRFIRTPMNKWYKAIREEGGDWLVFREGK